MQAPASRPADYQAAVTLRKVAANARSAASLAGSLTFECSITFELPSFGSLCAGPISISAAGAIRRASGAIASPASAAAATAVTPPPTKRSRQAMPALSSARTATARTPQGGASVASGSGSPRGRAKRLAANQAELVLGEFLSTAAAAFLAHDHRIEPACVIGVLHLAREADGDGEGQLCGHRMQAFEQRYQFRARGVVGDAERERLRGRCFSRQRAVMRLHQRASTIEERCAVSGEPHRAGRALDQAFSQQRLQPLQFQADSRLRRAKRFGSTRKALEVGDQQEGLDGGDVEGGCHYERLSLVSIEIRYQNDEGRSRFLPTPREPRATLEENDHAPDHRVRIPPRANRPR